MVHPSWGASRHIVDLKEWIPMTSFSSIFSTINNKQLHIPGTASKNAVTPRSKRTLAGQIQSETPNLDQSSSITIGRRAQKFLAVCALMVRSACVHDISDEIWLHPMPTIRCRSSKHLVLFRLTRLP
jgi:hypothetical protein